jgi:hypothetical protein
MCWFDPAATLRARIKEVFLSIHVGHNNKVSGPVLVAGH